MKEATISDQENASGTQVPCGSHQLDYYGELIQQRGSHNAAFLLADECRKADREATILKNALWAIIIRCREGAKTFDWLPIIAHIAEDALGANAEVTVDEQSAAE